MADLSPILDSSGNYILDQGQIVNGNELITRMRALLVGSFCIYYPEMTSRLVEYLQQATMGISVQAIRDIVLDAWTPLIRDGSIEDKSLEIQIKVLTSKKLSIIANCKDNKGQQVRFIWQNYGTN